jgi:16S rRNA (uracil1498-N3)-methyltransferase
VALPRFLAADLDAISGSATLSPEETHHLTSVLRLRFGDEIAVFDGNGREYRARIERVSREGAQLRLIEELQPAPEPSVRLTLAQAVLKGERMDDVVRDATMMGVAAIEPLVTEHTIARGAIREGRGADRWRRIAIASAKQCRRAVLPIVGEGTPFLEWVVQDSAALRVMLVEPEAPTPGHALSVLREAARPASATLAVGPEGGWTGAEVEFAVQAGWVPVTLGRRTLRADAVPIVAIGVLQAIWEDL